LCETEVRNPFLYAVNGHGGIKLLNRLSKMFNSYLFLEQNLVNVDPDLEIIFETSLKVELCASKDFVSEFYVL
jgi:hypothetical protein